MKIESVPIDSITLDPKNARVHNARNIEAIQKSLVLFGQQKPVVVDRDNIIRAGNGTVAAARALGWAKIDIVRTKLTGADATAYGIADNRLNELSDWDPLQLASLLDEVAGDGLADVAGFDEAELDDLMIWRPANNTTEHPTQRRPLDMASGKTVAFVRILLAVPDVGVVERALYATGCINRAEALMEVCREYEKRQQHA